MIRADVQAETCPIIGSEAQAGEYAQKLLAEYETDSEKLWKSNLFGKSLYELVSDGLNGKITAMPDEFRYKFRNALTKIVNEGGSNMICFVF